MHDAHHGTIKSTSFNKDESFFFSVATDGLLIVHQFDKDTALEDSKYDALDGVEGAAFLPKDDKEALAKKRTIQNMVDKPAIFADTSDPELAMDEAALSLQMKTSEPTGEDADPEAYSIQQSKLRTEEDHRLTLAERKKEKVRD